MEFLMAGLAPHAFWAAMTITLFAGFVKGAVGFAMPMIMISAFSSFLPPEIALAGLILPTLFSNISQAFRQGWRAALATAIAYRRMLIATIIAILISILEAPFVHVEKGTPQEVYVWPYFARMPLKALTPQQRVELFRIVTGADYKEMQDFGAYSFYRLGIGPDGTWHYFVSGD